MDRNAVLAARTFGNRFDAALANKMQNNTMDAETNRLNAESLSGLREIQGRGGLIDQNRAIAAFDAAGNIGNASALRDINTVDLTSAGGARSIYGTNTSGQFGGQNGVYNPLITNQNVAKGYGALSEYNPTTTYGNELYSTPAPVNNFDSRPSDPTLKSTFATGGLVGSAMEPMDADYDLFRKASATAQIPTLDRQTAIKMMSAIRAAQMSKQPTMGYADGGSVDTDGMVLDGPGTERSDSIPAIIDGERPGALSKGEMVIPKHVVEYYGTKHFDGLLEKARMAMKKASKGSQPAAALR